MMSGFDSRRAHHLFCSHSLTVRTLGFHPGNRGSIPRASTKTLCWDVDQLADQRVLIP